MFDILVKNGTIIDGSGDPMFSGDIGIKEGKIKEIGDLHNDKADLELDASGKYVTPGFVDINNHSDTYWRMFLDPNLESLIHQGITTIVGGNCGSSLAPLADKRVIYSIQKWADIRAINFNWLRMEEFLDEVEKNKLSVNFATLVGHATLRRGLLVDEVRSLNTQEVSIAKNMLQKAMSEGAFGFSTGLVYTHAKLASAKEIADLAEVVKKYDGIYATHVRGEAGEFLEAIDEALRIAQSTGVRLQISHLKVMGEKNWHLMDEALNKIAIARSGGVDVAFDVYPYTTTGSVLYVLLPDWVAEGGKKMMVRRLKDPKTKARVIQEMQESEIDYSKITISISPLDKTLTKKKITEVAVARGKSIEETIVDILVACDGRVVTTMDVLSEENVKKAITSPFSIIASNGAGYNLDHRQTGELVHPRNFGSLPRILARYVREKKLLSWEEAIRKMTTFPAERMSLKKRGAIKVGNFADVLVIDPEKINDFATSDNPYQYASGIESVIVNGEEVLKNGTYSGKRVGVVIRK